MGQIIRIALLLGMTAYAYRKIGKRVAAVLIIAVIVVGVLALVAIL